MPDNQKKRLKHDVLIIGGGLAGLSAALRLAGKADVAVISKTEPVRSQSVMAQGGINAAISPKDSVEQHIKDTIESGDYLCDQDAVEILCREAESAVHGLDRIGALFTRDGKELAQRKFGAQSFARTCHSADRTGHTLVNTIYEQCLANQVRFYEGHMCLKLVMKDKTCTGVIVLDMNTGSVRSIDSKAVLLATGGYSRVFKTSTNSMMSTADGQALVLNAGLPLEDMEFVQFHPTGIYPTGQLVTEAARGEGALLVDKKGRQFMSRYSKKKELATRDVVTRALAAEMKKNRTDHLYLDMRKISRSKILAKLPQLYETALKLKGLDCSKQLIPVAPTAHYSMGGIPVNTDCQVLTGVKGGTCSGLYAAGECACVSVHGANRVGGNSLLETVVFGGRAAERIEKDLGTLKLQPIPELEVSTLNTFIKVLLENEGDENVVRLRDTLQKEMQDRCGIFRKTNEMKKARKTLSKLRKRMDHLSIRDKSRVYNTALIEALEFRNLLDVAEAVLESALSRKESRGAHFLVGKKTDNKAWLKHTFAARTPEGIDIDHRKVAIKHHKPGKMK